MYLHYGLYLYHMPAKVLIMFLEITSYYHGNLSKRNSLFDIDSSSLAARELFLLM